MTTLVVKQAFGDYQAGQQITDPATIAAIQASSNARYVVPIDDGSGSGLGGGNVTPTQPNAVTSCVGVPSASLAVTYGYALDLTSTPATLYHWNGTAWVVVLSAGTGGGSTPVLATLTLATLNGTAGAQFSSAISGTTAGSTLSATSSDGTALGVTNGTLTGTFASAGSKTVTVTETLAGAVGSPKPTAVTVTIAAATPVLQSLGLSTLSAVAGQAFSAAITGNTSGSTVAATSSDGTTLSVASGQVSGTFAAAGSPTITLTETLAGATGSPKSTQLTVTVTAVAVDRTATTDLSNPDRGLNPLI